MSLVNLFHLGNCFLLMLPWYQPDVVSVLYLIVQNISTQGYFTRGAIWDSAPGPWMQKGSMALCYHCHFDGNTSHGLSIIDRMAISSIMWSRDCTSNTKGVVPSLPPLIQYLRLCSSIGKPRTRMAFVVS